MDIGGEGAPPFSCSRNKTRIPLVERRECLCCTWRALGVRAGGRSSLDVCQRRRDAGEVERRVEEDTEQKTSTGRYRADSGS
jgi:hypothetical protein